MTDRERKLKDRASKLYAEGKLKEALKVYEEIVAQDPSELQCRIKIGDLYRKLGNGPAAVKAYSPVARAYAEDGLLLKSIAVCKMILSVDPRHTITQDMLADLYSKRRTPTRMPLPPRALGNMPGPIELPEVDGEPEVERTHGEARRRAPEPAPAEPPPAQWPPRETSAPMMAWPVTAPVQEESIEDSVLDITVGEVMLEEPRSLDSAVELLASDTSREIDSLLSEMGDEPIDFADERSEEVIELDRPKPGNVEETWDGVIKVENLDTQELLEVRRVVEEVAETLAVDDAPSDVREAAPIELTQRVVEATDDLAEALERPQIPLFSELPKSAFIELLVQMEMREMVPGEYVIREGEVGDSFFVIATGRVRVVRTSETGAEISLAYLTDGAFFGEMALLQDGARTASVIVEDESQIFEISRAVLDRVVASFPSVANILRNFYKQRLLSTVMATHPLFSPFDAEQRRSLMEMFKSKSFKKDEVLLRQGKKGSGLFLLLNGKLSVVTIKDDGQEVALAELGPGDVFGEMSLLTNSPITASITAETDCLVLRLSKKNFDEVIMTHPQILELVAEISDERRSFNDTVLGDQPIVPTSGAILV